MSTDYLDELAALGHASEPQACANTLTDLVERNPIAALLAAAAAGAGAMALVALTARREPDPLAPVPLGGARGIDYDALKQQVAELADRLARAAPVEAAKQGVEHAGHALADGWSAVRERAQGALGRIEPQAGAALRVARENPVWTALILGAVGAVGALVGSQLLGARPAAPTEPQSDPSADA